MAKEFRSKNLTSKMVLCREVLLFKGISLRLDGKNIYM